MSKTKTALQIAIEKAEKHEGIVTRHFWINMLKELLPTERQQIEDSWRDGYYKMGGETTTDYFTSKYESNG